MTSELKSALVFTPEHIGQLRDVLGHIYKLIGADVNGSGKDLAESISNTFMALKAYEIQALEYTRLLDEA